MDHQWKACLEDIPRNRLPHQPETDVTNFEHDVSSNLAKVFSSAEVEPYDKPSQGCLRYF
jgi:hypothetical protein